MTLPFTPKSFNQKHFPLSAWNALVSYCGAPIPLSAKGATAVIQLIEPPKEADVAALVESAGLRAVVLFDAFPFAAAFEANLEAEDLGNLPVALRDVLIEGMVATLWRLIPENHLPHYRLLGIGDWREGIDEAKPQLVWLSIVIQGWASQQVRIRIGCNVLEIARALVGSQFGARTVWSNLKNEMTVAAHFCLERVTFPLSQVRKLKADDIVVLSERQEENLRVRIEKRMYDFKVSGAGWACTGIVSLSRSSAAKNHETVQMSENSEESAVAEAPFLDDLHLDVDFDIGSARFPLATIETWQVGAVVTLDAPASDSELEVTIRVNDQTIAKGDLIRIDDRFAVKITRLIVRGGAV